jgi:hypothetical protein
VDVNYSDSAVTIAADEFVTVGLPGDDEVVVAGNGRVSVYGNLTVVGANGKELTERASGSTVTIVADETITVKLPNGAEVVVSGRGRVMAYGTVDIGKYGR